MSNTLTDLIKSSYGVYTQPVESAANLVVGVAVNNILPFNDNRLGLSLVNNGTTTIYISTKKDVAVGQGYRLLPGGGSIVFDWTKDFHLVGQAFYAIGSAAAGSLFALEVVTYGKGKEK